MTLSISGITSADCRFGSIAVLAGPSIDEALDRAEALAMALDASTILLSSRLAALPAAGRRMIVCHELAHLVQLWHGGSDAEDALEAEAWQAAECAVRGLPFRIRLGADHPLFATALIAMDGDIGNAAMDHYKNFKAERQMMAPIPVTTVKLVSPVALDALLDAIIKAFPGVSGPDVKSSWMMCKPNIITAKQFDVFAKTKGTVVSKYPPGRIGILVNWGKPLVTTLAESNDVVPFWLEEHFFRIPPPHPPNKPPFEAWMANFGWHALHTTPILFPKDTGFAAHIKLVFK